ncbi:2-amino-4-hydroxy-6-hydroxymethyldihydropteridine diphosphokinase [Nakamurella endophytica]|uniref:2-amino-4-hydroxy-6-hydroxymethyldihydropteridine diphosphokinase n=1 Tax=Nakamurella endophytica TaxID=1748367 RepID=A0A917T057_9ACTN|nr:2-amino-4-hydroxy-6-hydroxymethyldihydropteridine diphosphokinase [Nakamurella endophytica]GGM04268.1 2-amino-4-hydroxy-6-hydroxymethyldihydropteridine diphosphokinase [Nakamurella endophytica]
MTAAVLSMGSNVGDRMAHLSAAVRGLGHDVRAVSSVYRTPPWGPVEQPDYYNLVVLVDDDRIDARGWLQRAQRLEGAAGRVRTVRWGPRTLDVDVVTVEGVVSTDPDLTLPHPRAHERAFVLVPWAELDPTAELPGHGRIDRLLEQLPPAEVAAVVRVGRVH